MENFLYFYTTGNGVHTFGTHRSSYNMGMISANYGKFFVLLYYGERCTHIWYTPFLLQYGYDFGQIWKIFCPSIARGTVYTQLVHTVSYNMAMISANLRGTVVPNVCTPFPVCTKNFPSILRGTGVHTFGTHRSSYNMGMIFHNYGNFLPSCTTGNGVHTFGTHRSSYNIRGTGV